MDIKEEQVDNAPAVGSGGDLSDGSASSKTVWLLFLLALALVSPMIWLDAIPSKDVAFRYAPMADAFAAGDWKYAFHPRVPMLHPLLAGIVAYSLGCGGFLACKMVSGLFYALSVFPAFYLFKGLFGKRVAVVGTSMVVLCSHLLRLGHSGLRGSLKEFLVLMVAFGLISLFRNRDGMGYVWLAIGASGLIVCRVDTVLFAIVLLTLAFGLDLYSGKRFRLPWRSTAVAGTVLVAVSPALIYNYVVIGYPVPEVRLGIMMGKVLPQVRNPNAKLDLSPSPQVGAEARAKPANTVVVKPNEAAAPQATTETNGFRTDRRTVKTFANNLWKGFYPYFFVFAIPAILFRIRKRSFTVEEWVLLSILLGHAFLLVLQILVGDRRLYVSRRYLLPAAPLSFGWGAMTLVYLQEKLKRWRAGKRVRAWLLAPAFLGLLFIWDAWQPIVEEFVDTEKGDERRATLELAAWIRSNSGPQVRDIDVIWESYCSNKTPVISMKCLPVVAYLAGGRHYDSRIDAMPDMTIGPLAPDRDTPANDTTSSVVITIDDRRYLISY